MDLEPGSAVCSSDNYDDNESYKTTDPVTSSTFDIVLKRSLTVFFMLSECSVALKINVYE